MQKQNVKLVRIFGAIATVALFFLCVNFQSQPAPKKFKLEITYQQAQLIVSALGDCDCPRKSTEQLLQYIGEEYRRQFPAAKPDSLARRPDSSKRHP